MTCGCVRLQKVGMLCQSRVCVIESLFLFRNLRKEMLIPYLWFAILIINASGRRKPE
jgi:hypothetical protein